MTCFFKSTCVFLLLQFGAFANAIEFETLRGQEVVPYLEKLVDLRISFYRAYPYLYEAESESEWEYVNLYGCSQSSVFVVAKQEEGIVGIMAGLSAVDAQEECQQLFIQNSIPLASSFYLGDVVLAEGTSKEMKKLFYEKFEAAIPNDYRTMYVCEIERETDAIESFWEECGFTRTGLSTSYVWRDIDSSAKTDHLMLFFEKERASL